MTARISQGQIRQVYDNGGVTTMNEDLAEDGHDHPVSTPTSQMMVRMEAMSDGGRHVVSGYPGESHDSVCHVTEGGRTLQCTGTHKAADGTAGNYICVYHRDPHVIPISSLAPPMARGIG